MKQVLIILFAVLLVLYLLLCGLLFVVQESLLFFPQKLNKNHQFTFRQNFEEVTVKVEEGVSLHGLLFKTPDPKGVIFYLHGNAGSLDSWGEVAAVYTELQYDVFMLDYRGYGKSDGAIRGQAQFYQDMQKAYDHLLQSYPEDQVVVLGYSIGSGPAAKIAADNHPRLLILQAPYYSLPDVMRQKFPIIPTFILKYKFETYQYLQQRDMPVVIFHGSEDEVIPYSSAVKLKAHFKPKDTLITLQGQAHNGMTYNQEYLAALEKLLK